MKIKSAFWNLWTLLVVCLVIFIAQKAGKSSEITWLNGGAFQRGTAILLCFSESLGILLSLKVIIEGKATITKRILPLLVFSFLYLSVLGTYLAGAFYYPKLYTSCFDVVDEVTLPLMIRKLYQNKLSSEQEKMTAYAIYRLHGIAVPYKKDGSTYSLYEPTPKDIEAWKKEESIRKATKENLKMIQLLQKDFSTLSIIYISSFFTVLLIGGIAIGMKRKPLPPTQSP
jgi:hypothetical protein